MHGQIPAHNSRQQRDFYNFGDKFYLCYQFATIGRKADNWNGLNVLCEEMKSGTTKKSIVKRSTRTQPSKEKVPAALMCEPWGASTDLNTWIAGSHGFAYSSMRATGNPSAAILLQSKHWIDTLTSAHVSAWNARGDRFLASNFMNILKKKWKSSPNLQDS